MEFFSNFEINDEVVFVPRYRQARELGIAQEKINGNIVSVKFTEAKVFYDIYSPYWGEIFKDVQSNDVSVSKSSSPIPQATT